MLRIDRAIIRLVLGAAAFSLVIGTAYADALKIRPDAPERYVVKKGDTLWDISAKFLESPWLWPKIWNINPQVPTGGGKGPTRALSNPHLIYPGDVLYLRCDKAGKCVISREPPPAVVDGGGGEVAPPPPVTDLQGRDETLPPLPPPPPPKAQEDLPVDVIIGTGDAARRRPPPPGGTVRLRPKIQSESLTEAIPTIEPEAIAPFLTAPLVIGRRELDDSGYVAAGRDGRTMFSDSTEFYARGIKGDEDREFKIFRKGRALRDPVNGRLLAYEAIDLGDAALIDPGDPAKFVVITARQEIHPADRLLAITGAPALPTFLPRVPEKKVRGWIIAAGNAVSEIGPKTVVALSLGRRQGIGVGHVLRIKRRSEKVRDPVRGSRFKLPEEDLGLVMVFRTFDSVSYGLVMSATRPINLFDIATNP